MGDLPVFDRDREFMFIDANKDTDIGKTLIFAFFIFVCAVLFIRYTCKKEKRHQQYHM